MFFRRMIPVAVLAILAFAVPAMANMNFIPTQYGLSARGMAMGNAFTATTSDLSMTFFNPASLSMVEHGYVGLGYVYGAPRFRQERDGAGKDFETDNQVVLLDLIVSLRNLLTKGTRGLALGLSLSLDDNGRTFIDFRDHRDDDGQYLRYGTSSATIVTGLGVEIMPWLRIGLGAIVQMEAEVKMQVDTDLEGNTRNESFDQVAETVLTPMAGVLVPWKDWSIGAAWRMESKGQIGPIDADTLAVVGGADLAALPLEVSFRDSFIPQQAGAGFEWKPISTVVLAVDFTWYQWSRFVDFAEEEDDARDDIEITFRDTFVPRAGVEFNVADNHFLRAGYSYEMTPVVDIGTFRPYPDLNVVGFVILDNDKHVASIGYGYQLQPGRIIKYPIGFDIGLQMQSLVPRTDKTSDGVEYTSEGTLFAGAFTISFGF